MTNFQTIIACDARTKFLIDLDSLFALEKKIKFAILNRFISNNFGLTRQARQVYKIFQQFQQETVTRNIWICFHLN